MADQHFTTDFGPYVCANDSIHCTVDGIEFTATLGRDIDASPRDYDKPGWVFDTNDPNPERAEINRRVIAAWENDDWHYFDVTISAEKNGVDLGDNLASRCGIEGNFPGEDSGRNDYFRLVANDLLHDAIPAAKARIAEIVSALTDAQPTKEF